MFLVPPSASIFLFFFYMEADICDGLTSPFSNARCISRVKALVWFLLLKILALDSQQKVSTVFSSVGSCSVGSEAPIPNIPRDVGDGN